MSKYQSKDIFDKFSNNDEIKISTPIKESKLQKLLFKLIFIFFALAIAVAASTHLSSKQSFLIFEHNIILRDVALFLVFISQTVFVIYQFLFISKIGLFSAKLRPLIESFQPAVDLDYKLVEEISNYDIPYLKFLKLKLSTESIQMRERMSVLIGAIEKTGLAPIVITWFVAFYKDGYLSINDLVVYAITGLYFSGVLIIHLTQKIDRYVLVLESAITLTEHNKEQSKLETTNYNPEIITKPSVTKKRIFRFF